MHAPADAESKCPDRHTYWALVIRYKVQKGDTLWKIAEALTGDGKNWREFWPEFLCQERQLEVGTTMLVSQEEQARLTRTLMTLREAFSEMNARLDDPFEFLEETARRQPSR